MLITINLYLLVHNIAVVTKYWSCVVECAVEFETFKKKRQIFSNIDRLGP